VNFFADVNISPRAAQLLEVFDPEHTVHAHDAVFAEGTPDTEWIAELAGWEPRPVVIGGDARIVRNAAERKILQEANLIYVLLGEGWTRLSWHEFAWKLIKPWLDIVSNVGRVREPTLFEVQVGSLKIRRVGRISDWK